MRLVPQPPVLVHRRAVPEQPLRPPQRPDSPLLAARPVRGNERVGEVLLQLLQQPLLRAHVERLDRRPRRVTERMGEMLQVRRKGFGGHAPTVESLCRPTPEPCKGGSKTLVEKSASFRSTRRFRTSSGGRWYAPPFHPGRASPVGVMRPCPSGAAWRNSLATLSCLSVGGRRATWRSKQVHAT